MKVLFVHAHFDDYEFAAAGTFELWRRKAGPTLRRRVLVCTDGAGGHHCRTRAETGRLRLAEQQASAHLGGYEFELLCLPNGQAPREATLQSTPAFLPALWKAIRDFEPDYLFCPPLIADPLAGVHLDHVGVAGAVRHVAYLINVPHAFTPEYPADETLPVPCKVPVILTLHDSYACGANCFDLAVEIETAFDLVSEMAYCHQSQICEWLPWVGRHAMEAPKSLLDWKQMLRRRFERRNRELELDPSRLAEVFSVTAWGTLPTLDQLRQDFPDFWTDASHLDRLAQRLARWRGE